jgi:peptidoglycan/xylan/chitin deacetylase (PgdA/CDA1 family)
MGCGSPQEQAPQEENPPVQEAGGFVHTQIPVLYYHAVRLEEGNELCMPPEQLAEQLNYLREQGYRSIHLADLYEGLYAGAGLPEKPIVITFDDGYLDNYENAWPLFQKYGFSATVFVITDAVGTSGYLTWPQLQTLRDGGWEIAGHTATHPYLTDLSVSALQDELARSKKDLEDQLGQPVRFLAYPYGAYNAGVMQAVRDSGYQLAVTTERGWAQQKDSALEMKRVYCYANMGLAEFERRITRADY